MKSIAFSIAFLAATGATAGVPPATSASGETVYVAPRQTVPLLAAPQLGATTGRTVTTAEQLTIVARQGDFVQVRAADGALGWIRASNLSDTAPRPESAVQAENRELAQQVSTLDAQIRAFQEENVALRARLAELQYEYSTVTRPMPLTLDGVLKTLRRWLVDGRFWAVLALFAVSTVGAFKFGVRWRNEKIRERLGGLDL